MLSSTSCTTFFAAETSARSIASPTPWWVNHMTPAAVTASTVVISAMVLYFSDVSMAVPFSGPGRARRRCARAQSGQGLIALLGYRPGHASL